MLWRVHGSSLTRRFRLACFLLRQRKVIPSARFTRTTSNSRRRKIKESSACRAAFADINIAERRNRILNEFDAHRLKVRLKATTDFHQLLIEKLYSQRILNNSHRGDFVEMMVLSAL